MIALSFIVAMFAVSSVNGGTAFDDWGQACIQVSQLYPMNTRLTAWKGVDKKQTVITGYYKKMSSSYYKKVNDINCVAIEKMSPMYFMKSGSKYYLDPTRRKNVNTAKYSNCYRTTETFPKALCDAPGNGPKPNSPMKLSIRTVAASKCNTMWATTAYSDAVVLDAPSDWTSPLDDFAFDVQFDEDFEGNPDDYIFDGDDDDQPMDDMDDMPDSQDIVDDDFEQQPMLKAPVFEAPEDSMPFDSAPVIAKPATDSFTISIGKWSLLIITLIIANFATFMTILYCREKNKNVQAKSTEY